MLRSPDEEAGDIVEGNACWLRMADPSRRGHTDYLAVVRLVGGAPSLAYCAAESVRIASANEAAAWANKALDSMAFRALASFAKRSGELDVKQAAAMDELLSSFGSRDVVVKLSDEKVEQDIQASQVCVVEFSDAGRRSASDALFVKPIIHGASSFYCSSQAVRRATADEAHTWEMHAESEEVREILKIYARVELNGC